MAGIYVLLLLICCFSHADSIRSCTSRDIKTYVMPCDPKTRFHKVISYLHGNCNLTDPKLIRTTQQLPCTCPPGQGLTDGAKGACQPCKPGNYSAGGEHISDWGGWTHDGTKPPFKSGISTFCAVSRRYVKSCHHWKASYFNDSLESGDNARSRCMSSTLMIRKQFLGSRNYVEFTFRVEGRKCYRNAYTECDGLGFYIDNKMVLPSVGNQFGWRTVRFNVTPGDHELRWTYKKRCFSFSARGVADKAFIQSIILVGTTEPHTTCKPCPPGTYSETAGASECKKCNYFKHQPKPGQTSCIDCPPNQYSMLGAASCIPKLMCTSDDLVKAPDPISACNTKKNNVFMRYVKPTYSSVQIDGKNHTLCIRPTSTDQPPTRIPCYCQPGEEVSDKGATAKCQPCSKGMYSTDGLRCKKCHSGQVALIGKHFYIWAKGDLPEGFTAKCAGDCSNKRGWYPAGDHVRTNRVVGDVESYIQTEQYKVMSNVASIKFSCSILCNITKRTTSLSGNHLADIQYCNLVFEIWDNSSLAVQVNCTQPKGKYVYRPENYRDGRIIFHNYLLRKNGLYQFRWIFSQADELRSVSAAFEAKVFNISIIGVEGGSARECTPCKVGQHSISSNTDCAACPKGTSSPKGSDKCIPCKEGTFADSPASEKCFSCGANTQSLPSKDGCTTNDCKFSPGPGVEYDFSHLSREGGPMFEVLNYQTSKSRRTISKRSNGGKREKRTSPPRREQYWLNLCTVKHDGTSCTYHTSSFGTRKSLPVMGCRTSWWSRRDVSIGRVIGFKPKEDIRSGVLVQLLHGDLCTPKQRYHTSIDLTCDVDAGVGNPGPENDLLSVFTPPCGYSFKWKSLYACPKCTREDFELVTRECKNGTASVEITRRVPCWGNVNGIKLGVIHVINCSNNKKENSTSSSITTSPTVNSTTGQIVTESPKGASVRQNDCSPAYKVLTGVFITMVIILILILIFLSCKNRDLKYKLYSAFTRNKPMSKLKEEEEGFAQADEYSESSNIVNA